MGAQHTVEEAVSWKMRETAHYNGGKEWFGYCHQCIDQPRLSRMDRYTRKDRSVRSTWRVDGQDAASFEEALAELDWPPAISFAEMAALAQFSSEISAKSDFADFSAISDDLRTLADKGLVWWDTGKVKLLFPAIKQAIDTAESNASGNPEWEAVSARVNAARAAIRKAQGEA